MDLATISRLYRIFSGNKWTIKDGHEIVFDNFCELLSNLSEPQRNLIIELTESYTWITFSEYDSRLRSVLEKVEVEKLKSLKSIVLVPIRKPEDDRGTKSGNVILYLLEGLLPRMPQYKHISFRKIETFKEIGTDSFRIGNDEGIFLLDDYLGSGETVEAALTEILKNRTIGINDLYVIAIAAQKESLDFINSVGIPVYTAHLSRKGISDYYSPPILEEKTKIMLEIEKLIPGNHFSFGYKHSEAIITLIRTPDNTFPIFWKEYKKGGKKFEAPFARYQVDMA